MGQTPYARMSCKKELLFDKKEDSLCWENAKKERKEGPAENTE
jgi:hypothetical protein